MFDETRTVHRRASPRVGLIAFGGCGIVVLATAIGALVAYLVHFGPFAEAPSRPAASTRPAPSASAAPAPKSKR